MSINPIVLSIPVFFILIAIEVIYDRLHHKKLYRLNDALTNISCGITEQISGVFVKVATIALYYFVYQHFRLFTLPNGLLWGTVLFLGVDLAYYWAHRLSHEINLLWAGHVVHHQSEDYNLSVALRQGFMQKIFTSFVYLPLALFGFQTELFLLFSAWNTLYQFWIHTETIGKLGPLEWILNTPSHHRVHHGRDPKYIDKNHAGVLIIWDRLFGTFQAEEERPIYGVTTPVDSWNPVYAQVQHFGSIWADWKKVNGWDKFLLLIKKPGWLPSYAGGYRAPEPVAHHHNKFDTQVPQPINIYILLQYIVVLALTSWYLFQFETLILWMQISYGLAIAYSVMSLGILLNGKTTGFVLEFFRWLLLPLLLLASFPISGYLWLLITIAAGGMLIWLGWLQHKYAIWQQPQI